MGNSAEVAVGMPFSLIKTVPSGDVTTTAHWAAYYATGLNAYDPPEIHDDYVTVQMPPFAHQPATEGFAWMPIAALAGQGERNLAHLIFKLATWNTWRAKARIYAWSGLAAAIILAMISLGAPVQYSLIFSFPGGALGVAAIVAASADPFPGAARLAAYGAVAFSGLSAAWALVRNLLPYFA